MLDNGNIGVSSAFLVCAVLESFKKPSGVREVAPPSCEVLSRAARAAIASTSTGHWLALVWHMHYSCRKARRLYVIGSA